MCEWKGLVFRWCGHRAEWISRCNDPTPCKQVKEPETPDWPKVKACCSPDCCEEQFTESMAETSKLIKFYWNSATEEKFKYRNVGEYDTRVYMTKDRWNDRSRVLMVHSGCAEISIEALEASGYEPSTRLVSVAHSPEKAERFSNDEFPELEPEEPSFDTVASSSLPEEAEGSISETLPKLKLEEPSSNIAANSSQPEKIEGSISDTLSKVKLEELSRDEESSEVDAGFKMLKFDDRN